MRRIYFIIFVVALFGCGTLEKKSILINIDDDKQKVLSIMGTPDDRQMQGKQEAWQYCISGAGFGYNDHRVVWFNNGYVTGITSYKSHQTGCVSGIRQVRWEDAPDRTLELRVR